MSQFDEHLWNQVIGHPDTKLDPPASDAALADFESRHAVALPISHRNLLLRGNGGSLGDVRLFGIGRSDALDLDLQVNEMRPEIEPTAQGPVLPFASDWGGSYFCFDLRHARTDGEYPVLLWDHEHSEEPEDLPFLWSDVAPDFPSFLRKVTS